VKAKLGKSIRVVIYARGERGEQVEGLRAFCRDKGWILTKVYIDAPGAVLAQRPQLGQMLHEAMSTERSFEKIVVQNLSQISRDYRLLERMEQRLLENGVELVCPFKVSVKQGCDGLGTRLFNLFNEHRSDWQADAVRQSLRDNARQGHWTGGKPPYGFSTHTVGKVNGRVKKKLMPEAKESKVILKMFDLLECGDGEGPLSVKEIAIWLNRNGRLARGGKTWTTGMVFRLLQNRVLMGEYFYGKSTNPEGSILVQVPEIVSTERFEKAQKLLLDRATASEKSRGTGSEEDK
jgi:DNA invertase Pin-like site-specific DNA recombinase